MEKIEFEGLCMRDVYTGYFFTAVDGILYCSEDDKVNWHEISGKDEWSCYLYNNSIHLIWQNEICTYPVNIMYKH